MASKDIMCSNVSNEEIFIKTEVTDEELKKDDCDSTSDDLQQPSMANNCEQFRLKVEMLRDIAELKIPIHVHSSTETSRIEDEYNIDIVEVKYEPLAVKDPSTDGCVYTDIKGKTVPTIKSEYRNGTHISDNLKQVTLPFHTNYECDIKHESNAFTGVELAAAGDSKLIVTRDISQIEAHDCRLQDKEKHHCDICQQPFATAEYLIAHRYIHTDDANYTCIICRNTFHIKQHLHRHILNKHFKLSPFQCDTCHKSFTRKSNLTVHNRIHTGEKPYACETCHKSFTEKMKLIIHKRSHTGEKPYACDICHKSFAQNSQLIIHERIHSGVKPCECDICHKSFTRTNELTMHKRIHFDEKPYECEICHKSFIRTYQLIIHKRTHSGEKPYECDMCHKSFTKRSALTIHKRIHSGEKPYECYTCHKSFTQKGDLARHTRIHTGEKPYVRDMS